MNIAQKRERLRKDISYEEGNKIRSDLHEYAKLTYKAKHSEKYMKFMNNNACKFTVNGAQERNYPFFFTLFTCASQHVFGDCVEECLDKAIEKTGY